MSQKEQKTKKSFAMRAIRFLRHLLLHNGWFKLLAVFISIILWAGLISQDESLTRDKTFTEIPVTVSGTDTMKRNGYIVTSNLTEELTGVTAVAAVPQKQFESAEVSAYNVRVDLSRITGTGEQELKILSSSSSTYGRISSVTPSSIMVHVEDYVTRYRIPVSVTVDGEIPEGWYMSTPSVDPPLVVVSGPRTLVNSISRARVFVDPDEIDWQEGTAVFSGELTLFNRSGEKVSDSLLEISYESVSLDSVILEAMILPTKTFDVAGLIGTINEVAEGYTLKAVNVSPESLTVAARDEVLEQMTDLALSEHYVDLKDLKETTSFQIKVSKPSEDAILSNDTITVTVEDIPDEAEEPESEAG